MLGLYINGKNVPLVTQTLESLAEYLPELHVMGATTQEWCIRLGAGLASSSHCSARLFPFSCKTYRSGIVD